MNRTSKLVEGKYKQKVIIKGKEVEVRKWLLYDCGTNKNTEMLDPPLLLILSSGGISDSGSYFEKQMQKEKYKHI